MANNDNSADDKPRSSVEELCKTILTAAGLILTLLWGLTQRNVDPAVLWLIRIASIVLIVSMIGSLLGLQFIVTNLERKIVNITKKPTVAFSFLIAWVSFIAGCAFVILAIFKVH